MFLALPAKKDYPDYYKVITEPIDMTMIENKIKLDKAFSLLSLIATVCEFAALSHWMQILHAVARMDFSVLCITVLSVHGTVGHWKHARFIQRDLVSWPSVERMTPHCSL